jgi:mannose-1-phosphate guanylyltransferase
MKFIVMAGGLGTKLWPISRDKKPKQFQPMFNSKTLLQLNIESLLTKYKPEDIFIATNKEYLQMIKEQNPQVPDSNYIIEPSFKRDTGPATGYALLKVSMLFPNEPINFYVQPVVIREPVEKYVQMLEGIEDLIKKDRKLISGGQKPSYPDMGSDYFKLDKKVESKNDLEVYDVEQFVDRLGDYEKTKELLENNVISTHCNHYSWLPELALDAFRKYTPEWYSALMEIKASIGTPDEEEVTNRVYESMKPGRFEEVSRNVFNNKEGQIVILPFKWTHISTWNDMYEYSEKDNNSNLVEGNVINIDTKGTVIKSTNKKKLIATIGLEDMVIVDTDDALLICPRNKAGEIKKILEEIKSRKEEEFL